MDRVELILLSSEAQPYSSPRDAVNVVLTQHWETNPTWYPLGEDQDPWEKRQQRVACLDEGVVENKTVD